MYILSSIFLTPNALPLANTLPNPLFVHLQKFCNRIEIGHQSGAVSVAEIPGQDQVVSRFLRRALGDIEESHFFALGLPLETLGNIRCY